MKKQISLSLLLFSPLLWAEANQPNERVKVAEISPPTASASLPTSTNTNAEQNIVTLDLTDDELVQRPDLLFAMLNQAIDEGQWENVAELLKLYQRVPNFDPLLVKYGTANLLMSQGKNRQAVRLLREILAENNNFVPVRFRLAQALFSDYQNSAALDQFQKLKADNRSPEMAKLLDSYIEALQQRSSWDFGFYFNYLQEDNVNNAGKSRTIKVGNLTFVKNEDSLPQSAKGLSYGFNLSKNFNLVGSHNLYFENDFSAKQFWTNHRYDDLNNRTSLGYRYQDAEQQFALLPFYERRWYGGKRYNKGLGVRAEYSRWLTPNWRLSTAVEQGWNKYHRDERSNGRSQLYSTTVQYLINAKSYVYAGVDFNKEGAKDFTLAYDRLGGRLGWGQTWWKGISTRVQFSLAQRKYQQPHQMFQLTRKDKEYGVNVTLWKQDWHFWGVTPKLSWNWQKVKSNLPDLYSFDKQRVYLNFEKTF